MTWTAFCEHEPEVICSSLWPQRSPGPRSVSLSNSLSSTSEVSSWTDVLLLFLSEAGRLVTSTEESQDAFISPKKTIIWPPSCLDSGKATSQKNVIINVQSEDQFAASQVALYPIQLDITFILVSPGEGSTKSFVLFTRGQSKIIL